MKKHPTSFRLTPAAMQLLTLLAQTLGISQNACVELALREFAVNRVVKLPKG